MLQPCYLVGFTGHRAGFDETAVRRGLRQILSELSERAGRVGGRVELYASVAEGADTVCVEVARELNIAVHILLPLPEEEFESDFSSPEAWDRSARQLAMSKQRPGRDSVHLVPGEGRRPECYFNQGIYMLDAIDVLVAVWDGENARGLGGTAQIVDQAEKMKLPVAQVHPTTGEVGGLDESARCIAPDPLIRELNVIADCPAADGTAPTRDPEFLLQCLDKIAVEEAGRFRPSLVMIILLHGIAALLAAIVTFSAAPGAPWEKLKWVITLIELVLVSVALWMSVRLHRHHTQERWIRCRFACELVRGMRASIPILDPLHPLIVRHEPKWRRFALTAGLLVLEHQATTEPLALRDRYISERLSDLHREGQVRHYQSMRPSATHWWKLTGLVSTWSATLAPAFVLLSLLNKLSKYLPNKHGWHLDAVPATWVFVVFLPIALPLMAGVANSLRHVLDAGRRKDRYPEMAARLTEIRAILPGLVTPSTIQTAVARSEELLMNELVEWQLAMKNTGH